ncbi:hypothetical protein HDE_09842 [Halotydeus destructor]|nr:hypothetical protein HDE_09842 [Halotydeus destructor]
MKSASSGANPFQDINSASRWLLTFLIYFAFFSHGMGYALWGSVWPDLQDRLGLDGDTMKYGNVIKYSGCAVGAIVCGLLPESYNQLNILLTSVIFMIVSLVGTILKFTYVNFLCMQLLFGVVSGAIETVANILIIQLWSTTQSEVTAVKRSTLSGVLGPS